MNSTDLISGFDPECYSNYISVGLGLLLLVSEGLSSQKKTKSNGILDFVRNILGGFCQKNEELPVKQEVEFK